MSWDEYDDVQVREYMNRVELPEFLKANMENGDRWDGKLDRWKKYLSIETPDRTIKMVTMNDEQRAEVKKYIQEVNQLSIRLRFGLSTKVNCRLIWQLYDI